MASKAKKCKLENGNSPTLPALSESDIADMESFLENMILIYGVLGISVFETPKLEKNSEDSSALLYLKTSNSDATGFESSDGFVVLKGAKANLAEIPSIHPSHKDFRTWMVADELLTKSTDAYVLAQDYTFTSPSKAASILLGRNANGRVEWKNKDGKTLKDIQENI